MIQAEKSDTGREKTLVVSLKLRVPEFINLLLCHSQGATICCESVIVTELITESQKLIKELRPVDNHGVKTCAQPRHNTHMNSEMLFNVYECTCTFEENFQKFYNFLNHYNIS